MPNNTSLDDSNSAEVVRQYIQSKYPNALNSPLAKAFSNVAACDEADRVINAAKLQSKIVKIPRW